MPTKTFSTQIPTSPTRLFAWHTRPGAFERLHPPWQQLSIERPGPVKNGSRVDLLLKKGPLRLAWTAEHRDVVPGRGFTDIQTSGPFKRWVHRHEFEPSGADRSTLRDRIDYELPGGFLGRLAAGSAVAEDLDATFAYRHATTARDLARHEIFSDRKPLRVAVTGASGLVGSTLVPFLGTGGHDVVALQRRESEDRALEKPCWSSRAGLLEPESIDPFDAVVHLAGESVASGRWTPARKARIRDSRVEGTLGLVRSLAGLAKPPKVLVSASAIGFYGSRGDHTLDETAGGGEGFLPETCREWEAAALEGERLGIRVVTLRFGIILSPAAGALSKMLPPLRLGIGGMLGNGRQYMSWISIDDAVAAIHHSLLADELCGPVNAVAPQPVTNREFTKALGHVLRRPTVFPVPAPAARLAFGEMADEMLLASARVVPTRLLETRFAFDDPDLTATLMRLLGKARRP